MQNDIISLMLDASENSDYKLTIALAVLFVLFLLLRYFDNRRMERNYRQQLSEMARDARHFGAARNGNSEEEAPSVDFTPDGRPNTGSLDMIVDVLRRQGCEMEELDGDEETEDGRKAIQFMYQGESLVIVASNTSTWVRLYDRFWYSVPLDDIDKVAFLRKSINQVNTDYSGVKLLYTFYENKEMYVHSELSFTLVKGMPQTGEYIVSMFRLLLGCHGMLSDTMKELHEEENK